MSERKTLEPSLQHFQIKCDKCGKELSGDAASLEDFLEQATRQGWYIDYKEGKVTLCPDCANEQNSR